MGIAGFECIKCGHCCRTLSRRDSILPCPHLEGNLCSIYQDRPKACLNYPISLKLAIRTKCNGLHKGKKIIFKARK
jgi:Fe-S-cluster containining protein